jgi:hypothetical protein
MLAAEVADEDCLLLNGMALLIRSCAHVYTVLIIKTAADGITLDHSIAHFDGAQ